MTELEDLVLGIVASYGRLSFTEIVNFLSLSGQSDESKIQEAVDHLVADDLLALFPKQESFLPPAQGKSGDVQPGTVIRVSPEKYCIQKADGSPIA